VKKKGNLACIKKSISEIPDEFQVVKLANAAHAIRA
jgi:hypothetical protein